MTRLMPRSGFTLLEVLLASAIAVLLLGALYFAMDLTLRQTETSRESLVVDNLARGVLQRMSRDLSSSLGPLPPKSGGNNAGKPPSEIPLESLVTETTASGNSGSTSTSSSTSSTVGNTASSGSTSNSTSDTGSSESAAAQVLAADIPFQAGIIGSERQLTVFLSRVPDALAELGVRTADSVINSDTPSPSGLRRVCYWLAQNGTGGLCRQERVWITADGVRDSIDPDLSDEVNDIIAESVTDLLFEYFDGSQWLPSWDGSSVGADGVTPIGPPRAVRVTLWLELPPARAGDAPRQRQVVQVIPIRAAPGTFTPQMLDVAPDSDSLESAPTGGGSTP